MSIGRRHGRDSLGALARLVPIVVLCGALSLCASAAASVVTVGSPLTGTESPKECGSPSGCTVANALLGDPNAAVVSPLTGAVVRWRLGGATAVPGYQFITLRQLTAEEFIVTGATPAFTPTGVEGIETFPAPLPIAAGEYVGIDVPQGGKVGSAAAGAYLFRGPVLANGTKGIFQEAVGYEIAFNADVLPAPTVTSLGTTSGPTAGGTAVTITGTNFAEVKSVSFGSTDATYTVDSESTITATSPAGAAGGVPVTVTTVAGAATAGQQFTYTAAAPAAREAPAAPAAPAARTPVCEAPRLIGKRLKAAKRALKKADCGLGHVAIKRGATAGSGKVVTQKPKPGARRKAGTKVTVRLG